MICVYLTFDLPPGSGDVDSCQQKAKESSVG